MNIFGEVRRKFCTDEFGTKGTSTANPSCQKGPISWPDRKVVKTIAVEV